MNETTTIRFTGICDWPRLTGLVADAGKLRRLSRSQDDFIYFLPVAATSLRAGFQVYLSKFWVVDVTKAVRYDLLIYCLISLSGFIPGNVGRMDATVRCGRCLAGGRGCLPKGPHLIPSLKFSFPYSDKCPSID